MTTLPFVLAPVIGGAVAVIVLLAIVRSMWRVAEPNQALVISGLRSGPSDEMGFKIVCGAGTLVIPGLQRVRTLDLSLHEAPLAVDCVTQQGIKVQIQGVVIYKVGDDRASISNAARRFLDARPEDMGRNIQNLFDGHLRSIIGGITMEDLIRDREKLTGETRDAAGIDMQKLGLIIDSLQIKDIVDPSHYIDSLAAPHVAEVQKNARIAQANADQAATQVEQAAAANKAEYMRDTATKKASYQADIDTANARAAQAGPLSEATAKQDVVRAATATAALEASQKEQELQVSVRKPADAQAYSVKTIAEGNRDATIAAATAAAEQVRLNAQAQADAARVTGTADGEASKARGEGEAAAIQAKLLAEAAGIDAKGKALAANKDAVIAQTIAESVPQIVREASSAFDRVGNIAIVNGSEGMNSVFSGVISLGLSVLPQITAMLAKTKTN
ncbi:MAG: SPFH domain-containing protein [Candidatus Cybelea sp.]